MKTLILTAIILLLTTFVQAGEWNDKPVICADQEETFSAIASKGEVLIAVSDQLTKVRDPDEKDGISISPAILPWALYANLDEGTFTVIEYHKAPYNVYCVIGFGVNLKLVPEGLELRSYKGE